MNNKLRRALAIMIALVMTLSVAMVSLASDEDESAPAEAFDGFHAEEETAVITDDTAVITDGADDAAAPSSVEFDVEEVEGGVCIIGMTNPDAEADIVIPSTIKDLPVVAIGDRAFEENEDICSVEIPASVKKIGKAAFAFCPNLQTVRIAGSEVEIGDEAFAYCYDLYNIFFDGGEDGITTGLCSFDDTAWMAEYPIDWITLGDTLVRYKGVDSVVKIPVSVTKIGDGAFAFNSDVVRVELTPKVSEIGDLAFYCCPNLEYVDIPYASQIKSVGYDAFDGTAYLDNFDGDWFIVGNTLIRYKGDDYAVCVPGTVTGIASDAFQGAYKLSKDGFSVFSVRVPASVTNFEPDCFTLFDEDGIADIEPYLFVLKGTAGEEYAKGSGLKYSVISLLGDVDFNGEVTAADARLALRIAIGLEKEPTLEELFVANVDSEERISVNDARIIMRIALGFIDGLEGSNPATSFEVLDLLNKAIIYARNRGAGYTKISYQNLKTWNLDNNTTLYIGDWKTMGITDKNSAKAAQYERDSKEAAENLPNGGFFTTDMVNNFSCELKDGKYTVALKLGKETVSTPDPDGKLHSRTGRIFPVKERSVYDSYLANKLWFNSKLNSLTFDMVYEDCTLVAIIDAATGNLEKLTMDSTMHLDNVDGVINVMHVTNKGRTEGTGDIIITDRTVYSDFDYYLDIYPMEPTTAAAEGGDKAAEATTGSSAEQTTAAPAEPTTSFLDRLKGMLGS